MKRLRNLIVCLCPALLLLATGLARAETVVWSDSFDTNGASHWSASATGVWKIGSPTAGPAVGSSGYRTHSGADSAFTQGYAYNKDSRLVCYSYNGAGSLLIPSADQSPRLRFYHWFNFANALGYVEISADGGVSWTQVSPTYEDITGGGIWSSPSIDLSAYAGQNVLLAFHFTSGGCCGNALGWFVDDVAVVTGAPILNFPENFAAGLGDWSVDYGTWGVGKPTSGPGAAHSPAVNCAATVLAGNYANNVDSRLISPPFLVPSSGSPALSFWHWYNFNNALGFVEINDGTATITVSTNASTTTNYSAVLNTNIYQLFGSADPAYGVPFYWNPTIGGWTNNWSGTLAKAFGFVTNRGYYFEAGYAPFSIVGGDNVDYRAETNPIPQSAPTNFLALQGMTWQPEATESDYPVGYFATNAISLYQTNVTFSTNQSSWTQISPTYEDGTSSGWANVSLDLSTYASKTVQIAFHFSSGGINAAPGWYVDDLSLIGPPQLNLPASATNYDGQTLTMTIDATNAVLPGATYTFALVPPSTNITIASDGTSAVLTWSNMGVKNGVLIWTNNSAAPGTYTVFVKATDNSTPPLSVTNSFQLVILPPPPPHLLSPTNQTIYAGQTLSVVLSATNGILPNAIYTFQKVTPTNASISLTSNGELTWTLPPNQPPGTNLITVQITETNCLPHLVVTNGFVVTVVNPWMPVLTVAPPTQTIYAGQQASVTIGANNATYPNDTFTYEIISNTPNMLALGSVTNDPEFLYYGNFNWQSDPLQPAGTNTVVIQATDTSPPNYTATNSFLIVVLTNPPPPVLTLPSTQMIHAGQLLDVPVSASGIFPQSTFDFEIPNSPAEAQIESTGDDTAELTWTPAATNGAGVVTITVTVTDSTSGLTTSGNFQVIVSPLPPPSLTIPPVLTNYAGQTRSVFLTATNNTGPSTPNEFTYSLVPPTNNLSLNTASNILIWTTTGITNGILHWTNKPVAPGTTNIITVKVTDNISTLTATDPFKIVFVPPPPPSLSVPTNQEIAVARSSA